MEWLILAFVLGLTAIGVPIGYALVLSTAIFLVGKGVAPLTAIPLFILAGGLMETGGISLRLVNLASSVVGHIRGGLSMVTILATMIQSEISGSSVADAAAIGKAVIPAMEKRR